MGVLVGRHPIGQKAVTLQEVVVYLLGVLLGGFLAHGHEEIVEDLIVQAVLLWWGNVKLS